MSSGVAKALIEHDGLAPVHELEIDGVGVGLRGAGEPVGFPADALG